MKKFATLIIVIFLSIIPAYGDDSKKGDKPGPEEGFCASCQGSQGKATYSELTWSPVSQISKSGAFVVAILEDGSRISTTSPDRASLFCLAMASGLNVIVHWDSLYSYDMIYVGR